MGFDDSPVATSVSPALTTMRQPSFAQGERMATVLLDLVLHFLFGRKAPLNPWQADTLEWASGTPPRSYNFASLPPLPTRLTESMNSATSATRSLSR